MSRKNRKVGAPTAVDGNDHKDLAEKLRRSWRGVDRLRGVQREITETKTAETTDEDNEGDRG